MPADVEDFDFNIVYSLVNNGAPDDLRHYLTEHKEQLKKIFQSLKFIDTNLIAVENDYKNTTNLVKIAAWNNNIEFFKIIHEINEDVGISAMSLGVTALKNKKSKTEDLIEHLDKVWKLNKKNAEKNDEVEYENEKKRLDTEIKKYDEQIKVLEDLQKGIAENKKNHLSSDEKTKVETVEKAINNAIKNIDVDKFKFDEFKEEDFTSNRLKMLNIEIGAEDRKAFEKVHGDLYAYLGKQVELKRASKKPDIRTVLNELEHVSVTPTRGHATTLDRVKKLFKNISDADINAKNKNGETALFIAVRRGMGTDVLKYLIDEKKIDLNSKNKDGLTILEFAQQITKDKPDRKYLSDFLEKNAPASPAKPAPPTTTVLDCIETIKAVQDKYFQNVEKIQVLHNGSAIAETTGDELNLTIKDPSKNFLAGLAVGNSYCLSTTLTQKSPPASTAGGAAPAAPASITVRSNFTKESDGTVKSSSPDVDNKQKVMLAVDALIAAMGGKDTQITINKWPAFCANDAAFQKEVADYVLAKTGKPLIYTPPVVDNTLGATATSTAPAPKSAVPRIETKKLEGSERPEEETPDSSSTVKIRQGK